MKTEPSSRKNNQPPRTAQTARIFLLVMGAFLFISANVFLTSNVNASESLHAKGTQTAIPSPTPTFDIERLASPPAPKFPSQMDKGASIFWGVCIACHGDRGQGLTEEWRFGAYDADNDCWESGCHGKDHPDHGPLAQPVRWGVLKTPNSCMITLS
jgi:cytochrome c5